MRVSWLTEVVNRQKTNNMIIIDVKKVVFTFLYLSRFYVFNVLSFCQRFYFSKSIVKVICRYSSSHGKRF